MQAKFYCYSMSHVGLIGDHYGEHSNHLHDPKNGLFDALGRVRKEKEKTPRKEKRGRCLQNR